MLVGYEMDTELYLRLDTETWAPCTRCDSIVGRCAKAVYRVTDRMHFVAVALNRTRLIRAHTNQASGSGQRFSIGCASSKSSKGSSLVQRQQREENQHRPA